MSLFFGNATTDRVTLPAGLNNTYDPITVLCWHFITTRTNGRRVWGKGGNNSMFWSFTQPGLEVNIPRATTPGGAQSSRTYPTNRWLLSAFTFDSTDGPRIFMGDLFSAMTEDPYATRTVGVGALSDDSVQVWNIGNLGGASVAYQGAQALWSRFRRKLTLPELLAWQQQPFTDSDCDLCIALGERKSGSVTQLNEGSLPAFLGTASGPTVTQSPFPGPLKILPSDFVRQL